MAKAQRVITEILPEDVGALPAIDLVPYVDKNKEFAVRGNFEELKRALSARRDEIVKMRFSAKELETVVKYKKEAQGYRTMLAGVEKDVKARYFNGPKDVFSGQIAALQVIVADIEGKADKVLVAEEQKRVDALNKVFDIYISDFQQAYQLSAAGLARIERRPGYYNKTAKEAATKADLEAQFKDLKAKETARASGERTIRKLCAPNPLLDVESFVRLLDTNELANVMDMVEDEKARLEKASQAARAPESEVTTEILPDEDEDERPTPQKVTLGVVAAAGSLLTSGSDFPDKTKVMVLDITYPIDMGDALTAVFKELKKYGITAAAHKESVF
jgi:Protein of unknown function (DUF1351)